MEQLIHDVRFAARSCARRPGFTVAAVLTVALGIGANTAIFSVVRPLLLEPPPFPNADRIVRIYEAPKKQPDALSVTNPSNFDGWEQHTDIFEALGGYSGTSTTLTGAGDPERLLLATVTPGYFSVFGVQPALGRAFTDDEATSTSRVFVLSHAFWQRKFGGDPSIVGRDITLNGAPWRVIGVMPADFLPGTRYGWVPLHLTPELRRNRNTRFLGVVGRLRPGTSIERANAVTDAVMASLGSAHPGFNRNMLSRVVTWRDDTARPVRRGLWMLQAAALTVLLIAGANLSNLLLAQAAGRAREFSVRMALGAGRRRVMQQLVTEGVLVTSAGGMAGVILAVWVVPSIAALAPTWLPHADRLAVGARDVAAGLVLSTVTGVLFSLLPAALVTRGGSSTQALSSRGASSSRKQHHARSWLIGAQVGLALLLLSGAGLLVRSFDRLTAQPIGFDPSQVLTAELSLPSASYDTDDTRRVLMRRLIDGLNAHPAVVSASASTALPFTWWEWMDGFDVLGRPDQTRINTAYRIVTARYFETLRIPLARGRGFEPQDVAGGPLVAVVNEEFVRRHAGLGDPFSLALAREGDTTPITIVGVVGDTRHRSFEAPAQAELYLAASQWAPESVTLAVRTQGDPSHAETVVRQTLAALDPNLPIAEVKPLDSWVAAAVAERRFYMVLLSLFSGLAASLAMLGIYGVMAYVVRLRTREIGIRLALGATATGVTRLVIRQGMLPIVAGIAAGAAATWFATALLSDQLFQIDARDPGTLIGIAAGVLLTGVAACWMPSRRTSRVDPATVLQSE